MTTCPDVVVPGARRLAEGPVWDPVDRCLLWVDIPAGEVHRLDVRTGTDTWFEVGRPVGAVAPTAGGGLVLAVAEGFARCARDGSGLTVLGTVDRSSARSRMNDGACDAAGRFWAGTMDQSVPRGSALHRLDPDGSVSRVLDGVSVSNGLGWSPDDRLLYYVDSPTGSVDAFDFDVATGTIACRRTVVEIDRGRPDGLAVDVEGCLWVALWLGGAVQRFTPDGRLDRTLELPVRRVTSCAFGGERLDTLFVTTAHASAPEERDHADAGAVFAVDVGVGGLPAAVWGGP